MFEIIGGLNFFQALLGNVYVSLRFRTRPHTHFLGKLYMFLEWYQMGRFRAPAYPGNGVFWESDALQVQTGRIRQVLCHQSPRQEKSDYFVYKMKRRSFGNFKIEAWLEILWLGHALSKIVLEYLNKCFIFLIPQSGSAKHRCSKMQLLTSCSPSQFLEDFNFL